MSLYESENSTEFKIDFTVGSNTGKVTVAGNTIKVNNNGTTKPTAAQITAAAASATDANKTDGWVLDGTKWTYTMGTTTGTLNSLADLANIEIKANMTVSPVMKQNTYTVTLNGGKAAGQTGFANGSVTPATINYTTTVNMSNPTWTGYTFLGWSKTQQASVGTALAAANKVSTGTAFNTISGANEDTTSVTLYAWWEALSVPVKFNGNQPTNGGTVNNLPSNTTVSYGNSYTVPTTAPTSNGFTFNGWATSATGNVAYAAGATIPASALTDTTNGITLYAKWTEKTGYKVTFYANQTATADGTAHNTQSNLNWTGNVTLPAAPTAPAGYSFGGWFTTKSGTSATGNQMTAAMSYKNLLALVNSALTDSTMEIKMYAKWDELGKLTFTMNLNGSGASYNSTTNNYVKSDVLYNGSVSIPNITNPTRTGYNFKGWSDSASGAVNANYVKGYTFNNVTANKTIYAVWEAAPVTLTYAQGPSGNLAGVTNKAATTAYTVSTNYAATVTVPAGSTMFERNGYTFSNWAYAKTSGTGSVAAAGGNLVLSTSGINIVWTGSSEDGTLAGTAVVYPNWTAISYAIKWDTQGGNTINNTTGLNGDSTINTPANPTRAGYTFQGWHTTAAGTGGKDVVTGNLLRDTWTLNATTTTVTAYAIWKENIVEIRFYGDTGKSNIKLGNGTGAASQTLYVGAATGAIYPSASATAPGTGNLSNGIAPVISDTHYEWKVYTSGNDASYTSKWTSGSKNGAAVAAAWVNTTNGTLTVGTGSNGLYASADYYLTVSPKKYAYTIEYYNQNLADNNYTKVSNPSGSGTQFYGHSVTAGTTAGASGTTLTVVPATQTGFTRNAAAVGSVNSITIGDVAANNVLKFYYDRNTYTLTVNYTGDRPAGTNYSPATQTVKYGESVTLTNPTVPAGYSFSGWSATGITFGGSATPKNTFTMPASNVTVTGTWGVQTVNVTFKVGANGTINTASPNGAASQNKTFGSTMTAIPGVTITNTNNYYFMGWALYTNCTTAGNETTGTLDRIYSPEEILGTGAYTGNAWKVPAGNSTFVARIMPTLTVSYVAGTGGAFGTINGTVNGTTVTSGGTYYAALPSSADNPMDLPKYCVNTAGNRNASGFDPTGTQVRNANNPKAAAGYKFVGWTWKDTLLNVTKTCYGTYNAAGVFTKVSGDDMPTSVNQSYTFTGVWEKTYQQLHFVNTCVNGTGVTGGAAPADVCAQMGDNIAIPTASNYAPTNKPASAYTFKGWTTSTNYKNGDPLYNTTFQMTAGTQSTGVYTMAQAAADGGYGVTLYPVFEEKSVTINYALATGVTGVMGSLDKTSENIKMDSGTVAGSTATAKTGYTFKGWFADAAHTIPVATAWISGNKVTPQKGTGDVFAAATYYAYFEAEEYAIVFKVGDHGTWSNPAGTTADKTFNLAYNTTYGTNVPATVANTGYGFQHWVDQTGKTYTTSVLQATKITGPMTFTAVWEARSGFTIVFETNGGTPTLANKQVTWTANLNNSMDSNANNLKKQGYTFGGWYAKADFADASKIDASDTFQTGINKAGITVTGDTATLTLYAKWTPNTYTISYNPHWPKTNSTTYADRSAIWTDTGLLPAGGETLSMDGFTFTGWNTKADGTGMTVTNLEALSEIYVSLYGATDYSTTKTITLHALWGTKKFNVEFKDPSGTTLKSETGKNWDDTINYYNYTIADGSKRLLGWKYTPVGGVETTWNSTTATKLVSEIGGDADSATNGRTYILTAILEDCTKYEIRFNKVNLNADGTLNVAGATVVSGATKTGWTTPGVAIDIKNFNGQNFITAFENQNGAGRRADLKGYALDETVAGTKIIATAAEVTAGGTIVFNVYWVEKKFNIEYDLGASAIGNKPYAGTDPAPAGKTSGWNSTDVLPDTTPTWEGYKAPQWQYQNAAGNWVNVPAGAKVSDIAKSDDNTQTIILKALWNTDQVRITYAAQTGGSAKNGNGSFTVNAGSSKYQDIDAVNGTAYTMTATAASGYTFTGWYKDGILLTTDATMTPAKVDGLFTTSTYEARFRALGSITYTIEHWFEGLDGVYTHDASKDATRGGQEFATINVTNDMKLNVKGFTFKSGVTGEKLSIASLVDGEVLKLFYERNSHDVYVQAAGTGADAPTPLPTPTYTTTGITQAHTTHKYDTVLTLPTMTYDSDSWGFKWLVSYREPGTSTAADTYYNNGETFNMPDADVDIIGVWERKAHKVYFTAGDQVHGTVTVINGKTLPFNVSHGKSMASDPTSTGNYVDIQYRADSTWAWAGWEYADETGATHTTMNPDEVVINCDTTFKALWAQTFFVAYAPTGHGGAGFTTQQTVGRDIVINTPVTGYKLTIGGTDRTTNAPAADGYRFVGWTWDLGDGTGRHYWITPTASDYDTTGLAGTAAEMTFPVTNNVIFEAIWEALEQDLAYKLDAKAPTTEWAGATAGTVGDTFVVTPKPRTDQTVTLLTSADVSKAGHSFKGWAIWTDANGDGIVDDNELGEAITGTYKMPAHGVIFVPVWDFESITINFRVSDDSAGKGTLSATEERITDDNLARLVGSVPTANAGYVFAGWFTDAACTTPVDAAWLQGDRLSAIRPADGWVSATYFAKFIPGIAEYTIEFYLQNVDGTYTKYEATKHADINTESFADVNDAANAASDHVKTYAGYNWNQNVHEQILRAQVKGDGTTVLKLYYDRLPFDITYDLLDGGVWAGVEGPSSAIADSIVSFPAVNRPGYQHNGWTLTWTDPQTGAPRETTITNTGSFTMPAAAVHAIATYIKYVDVIIQYYVNDADPANKIGDDQLVPNAALAGTRYTVSGDDIRSHRPGGYSNPATAPSMIVVDDPENPNVLKVIYVRIAEYKLKFDPNGGTGTAYIKGDLALSDTVAEYGPTSYKRTGYTQGALPKRWNTAKDGTGLWITADTTYEEIAIAILGSNYDDATLSKTVLTVYAIWYQNAYEVKYDLNNDMDKNTGILKPVPDWRNPMIIEDKTGVSWNSTGFNILSDEELDAAPAGYEFAGWNTKADGSGMTITDLTKYSEMSNYINKSVEQKSITLYAMWKEIIIKIEYVTDGGGTIDRVLDNVSAVTGQQVGQGSSAGNALHSVATAKPGYHFIGWELYDAATHGALRAAADTTGVNAWHTIKNDDSELVVHEPETDGRLYAATYIARFAANDDASIEYDANGGEGQIDSTTMSHGLTVDLSDGTGFTRGHHTLVSWNTKEDGTGTTYDLGTTGITMPEGGMKLYAQWAVNSYDVHTGSRDDEIGKVIGGDTKVEWGKPLPAEYIAALSATAKPRSTFTGWRYTMVDADTGQTHTGVVTDLSELIVRGPLTLEAEFETEPEPVVEEPYVSPVPKTGDERSMLPMLVIMMIAALAAAIAGLIAFIARRREDETETDELTAANGSQLVAETATASAVAVRTIAGNRRMVLRRALAASFVAVCLCLVGFAPGIAFADTAGTGPSTQSSAAQSDPVTSSTGSFQSTGPKAGYVGHQDSPSSSSSSSDAPKVAACGPAAAGTTSTGGSTAGYVGSNSSSTGTNAATSGTSAATSGTSASSAVKGGAVQYVTTTGPKAGYTGTYISLSGPKAGYTGSSITMSGAKAGYLGSFNVVPVGEGSKLNTGTVTKGTVFVATPETRAAILSQLAHASTKSAIINASNAYSASDQSRLGFGTLYYYIPKASLSHAAGTLSGDYAQFDIQARDLNSLGSMSLSEVAALAGSRSLTAGLLDGASNLTVSLSAASPASVSDAIASRNKWMLSSISPSANVLGAACLLADLAGSLEGSAGALPTGSDGSVNAFPDMGEARLRDEDMVLGRIGLTPDVFAELFGEAQVTTSSLLLVDDENALYVMPLADVDEIEDSGDGRIEDGDAADNEEDATGVEGTEPTEPQEPDEGEEGTDPVDPENPDDADDGDPKDESGDPEDSGDAGDTGDSGEGSSENGSNSYVIHFDSNGGKLDDASGALDSVIYSNGSCSIPSYTDTLTRPGYSFLCWNTKANGSGVAIRDYEGITDEKLLAMFAENDLKDEDGADTKLYAQWSSLVADPSPSGISTAPTRPSQDNSGLSSIPSTIPSLTINQPSAVNQTVSAIAQTAESQAGAVLAQAARTAAAFWAASPIATVTSLLDVVSAGLVGLSDALSGIFANPSITLDVAPVTSGSLVTVSNEVLAGVGTGQDGIGDVSPVVATQVVGAVATAVTLVVAAAAVTGSVMFSAGTSSAVTAASAGVAGAAGAAAMGDAAAEAAAAAASRRRPIRRLRRRFRVSESQSAEDVSKAKIAR